MAFTVLFDACVLYPAPLRDVLIRLGQAGLFRARWTERIQDEWIRAALENRPDLTTEKLARTRQLMNEAIDDVLISSYEHLIASVELPDADDRHVLAAAVKGRADVIVTKNLKDFPAAELAKYDIEAQHPDVFITHVLNLDTPIALGAIRRGRESLKNPPKSIEDYLDSLAAQELPEAVAFLRRWQPLL